MFSAVSNKYQCVRQALPGDKYKSDETLRVISEAAGLRGEGVDPGHPTRTHVNLYPGHVAP